MPSAPPRPPYGAPPDAPRPPGPRLRSGRRALLLAVGGAVLLVPLLPAGLVLVVAGVIAGIRALRSADRQGGTAPGAVPAIVIGALGTVVGLCLLAAALFLLPELRAYRYCTSGARTELARAQCWEEFETGYTRRLGVVR